MPVVCLQGEWDGPFVVLDSSDKIDYQLATANGHILENLVNVKRLRKLDKNERKQYTDDFWEASSRLKLHDKRAKDRKQLHDLDLQLKKATLESQGSPRMRSIEPRGKV